MESNRESDHAVSATLEARPQLPGDAECDRWYRLDNAAKLYATIGDARTTTVFRVAATLAEPVDLFALQQAVDAFKTRLPYYGVMLRRGVFWHYLQRVDAWPRVRVESRAPCRRMLRSENDGLLWRVLAYKRRIAVEFSHVLTDGTGAVRVLRALVGEYLSRRGVEARERGDLMRPDEAVPEAETEYAYRAHQRLAVPLAEAHGKAFHVGGAMLGRDDLRVTTGIVEVAALRAAAKERKVSVTQFLAAVYIHALQSLQRMRPQAAWLPVRLSVPVNLRRVFDSSTMRNFFLSVSPEIDPRLGDYTLDEILELVHHSMRITVRDKYMNQQIGRNVGAERNWLLRVVPLGLKILAERAAYRATSTATHSGTLSNVGAISMPDAFAPHIERFEFLVNPTADIRAVCGVVSWRDDAYVTFGNVARRSGLERAFFTTLRKLELRARIETNQP